MLGTVSAGRSCTALRYQARYAALWFDKVADGFVRKRQIGDFWQRDGLSNFASLREPRARQVVTTQHDTLFVEHIIVEPLHRLKEV
jgi:hypothetical protein